MSANGRYSGDEFLTQAVRNAVRSAVLAHKEARNPVADWQDGRVVLIDPQDILLSEEDSWDKNDGF